MFERALAAFGADKKVLRTDNEAFGCIRTNESNFECCLEGRLIPAWNGATSIGGLELCHGHPLLLALH